MRRGRLLKTQESQSLRQSHWLNRLKTFQLVNNLNLINRYRSHSALIWKLAKLQRVHIHSLQVFILKMYVLLHDIEKTTSSTRLVQLIMRRDMLCMNKGFHLNILVLRLRRRFLSVSTNLNPECGRIQLVEAKNFVVGLQNKFKKSSKIHLI